MKILLSIKPEFVNKIFNGNKKYEYRKNIFKDKSVSKIIVYSTKPIGRIVGELVIGKVIEDSPSQIWNSTKEHAGISKEFFDTYFKGREKGYAIEISKAVAYPTPLKIEELGIGVTPPQSFRYIGEL